jgi:hypothetical protein
MGWIYNAFFGHFGVGISIYEGGKVRKKGKSHPNLIGHRPSRTNRFNAVINGYKMEC